jgi:hypothetical protein
MLDDRMLDQVDTIARATTEDLTTMLEHVLQTGGAADAAQCAGRIHQLRTELARIEGEFEKVAASGDDAEVQV